MRRSMLLLAAPYGGKGYSCKLLTKQHENAVEVIGTGKMIRTEMDIDPQFKEKTKKLVAARQYVDDQTIMRLTVRRLTEINSSATVVLDGYRTVPQLMELETIGLLGKKTSSIVILNVNEDILWKRAVHRRDNQPDGKRVDDMALEQNFADGQKKYSISLPPMVKYLRSAGFSVVPIEANGDLKNDVFPQINGIFEHVHSLDSAPVVKYHSVLPIHSVRAYA
ncbi:MAG: nucleoside monophosphate kinase [bacterium]|nr:nucleoside monophosphate kinase [bacterium]